MREKVGDSIERSLGNAEAVLRREFAGKRELLQERGPGERNTLAGIENTVGSGFEAPPRLTAESEFHWFHPPLQGHRIIAVLSAEPIWYAAHWHTRRMRLCEGENCEMCLLQLGRQLRYVVCGVDLAVRAVGFLETGVAGAEVLKRAYAEQGQLRGTVLAMSRASRSKNSRIELDHMHEVCPSWAMEIPTLDINAAMHQTWARMKKPSPTRAHD